MKKLIAVFVVFAIVTGAVFAQEGSWSLWTNGEIGTRLDFLPWQIDDQAKEGDWRMKDNTKPVIIVGAAPYENYDHVSGKFGLSYRREGVSAGFDITQQDPLKAWVSFGNDVRGATFATNLWNLFGNDQYPSINELFGWYNFLDGKLNVEVTARRGWQGAKWATAGVVPGDQFSVTQNDNYLLINTNNLVQGLSFGIFLPGMFDMGQNGWSNQMWQSGSTHNSGYGRDSTLDNPASDNVYNFLSSSDYNRWHSNRSGSRRFVEGTLEQMLLGARYRTGPLGIGTEFQLLGRSWTQDTAGGSPRFNPDLRSRLYLGVTYDINSQMRAELDFRGFFFTDQDTIYWANRDADLNNNEAIAALNIGARFQYTDGPMQARLDLIFFNDVNRNGGVNRLNEDNFTNNGISDSRVVENGIFRIRPFFRYDIVPTHLRFTLDTKFDIPLGEYYLLGNLKPYEPTNTDADRLQRAYSLAFSIRPEFFLNAMGTGAGGWGNGIAFRYRLEGRAYGADAGPKEESNSDARWEFLKINGITRNSFDVVFKWNL